MANIQKCMPMTDHFEGIDKLVKEAPHTDGAPNFRRVSEFGVNEVVLQLAVSFPWVNYRVALK